MIEGIFDKDGKSLQIQCHLERDGKKQSNEIEKRIKNC
ncbi:MAG: hypothetical protein CM15mP32_1190 [Flavobacteriaceae bacterium]|nr:MAG: hypothetical protein CM15mP32_1190 [Flavobacteriaceae bacterium]